MARDSSGQTLATTIDQMQATGDGSFTIRLKEPFPLLLELHAHHELDARLRDLEANRAIVYSAVRHTSIVGKNWPNQTPMPVDILYLLVHLKGKIIKEFLVPRDFRFGI